MGRLPKENLNIVLHPGAYPQGHRSIPRLLEEYDGLSLKVLKEQLSERDYQHVYIGRSIRNQLAAHMDNPRDLRDCRTRIREDLQQEPGTSPMALGIGDNMAHKIIQAVLSQLHEGDALNKSVRRMITARQNETLYQLGYDMAHKEGASSDDIVKGADMMDRAIKNDTKLFQLDTPDEQQISRDDIVVPDLMATVRWGDVRQGQGVEDLDAAIDTVKRKALRGVIDLKQMPNGTWAMEDFGELGVRSEELGVRSEELEVRSEELGVPNKDVFDGEEDQSILSQ